MLASQSTQSKSCGQSQGPRNQEEQAKGHGNLDTWHLELKKLPNQVSGASWEALGRLLEALGWLLQTLGGVLEALAGV